MRWSIACLLTLAVSAQASAQTTTFEQILSGKDYAHTLKLRDLTPDWRRLTISTSDSPAGGGSSDTMSQLMQAGMMGQQGGPNSKQDAMGAMLGLSLFGGLLGGRSANAPVYYTRAQTVTLGGETFLVAYRFQKPEVN